MVLNILKPESAARFPDLIKIRKEKTLDAYKSGYDAAESKFSGLSREEVHSELKRLRKSVRGHQRDRARHESEYNILTDLIAIENDLEFWASDFLTFQKPDGGAALALRSAFAEKKVFSYHEIIAKTEIFGFEDVFEEGEIFRIEHDWFKAIQKADEFDSGSFRLPFETSIFEFQVSGKSVVAMCLNYAADSRENEIVMQLAIKSLVGWSLSHNLYRHNGGHWEVLQGGHTIKEDNLERLVRLIGDQIRAACIALDAEVASAALIRESHAGHDGIAKEHPSYEFYTISLAARSRAEALGSSGETKGIRRLHFRRGHWRHFSTSKTWVRWCLVGNPELGFIDKQYRL